MAELCLDQVLPREILIEILSRLSDVKDLANCSTVNKTFGSIYTKVKKVRFLCKLRDVRLGKSPKHFKDIVTPALRHLSKLECLHFEIKDDWREVEEEYIMNARLSLVERLFILKWLQPTMTTMLQNLTIINFRCKSRDHTTPLLQLLSTQCKQLRRLELEHMYLNSRDLEKMNQMTTLILRYVKLMETGLKDVNECMPQLETVTIDVLDQVLETEVHFTSNNLKDLDIYLPFAAKSVTVNTGHLVRLRLKMACTEICVVDAPELQYLALAVDNSTLMQFRNITLLKELEMNSSHISTLGSLTSSNPCLEKLILGETWEYFRNREDRPLFEGFHIKFGKYLALVQLVRNCCQNLQTLGLGCHFWFELVKSLRSGDGRDSLFLNCPPVRHVEVQQLGCNKKSDWDNKSADIMCFLEMLVKVLPALTTVDLQFLQAEVDIPKDISIDAYEDIVNSMLEFNESLDLLQFNLKMQFPQLEVKCYAIVMNLESFFVFLDQENVRNIGFSVRKWL